jgi:alpha-glucosidase
VYEIYIRSLADASGDGYGDIDGIRSRLPYLRDLGVDAVWITPWYPSPMADGGYDIADYRDIDPMFGTLAQAEALITEVHDNNLRILIDMVPNHTSDRHPWFQAALAAGPGSPERDWYIFRSGRDGGSLPPNDWTSVFGGPAWSRVPDGEWYLHLFAPEQPDLNWDNENVRAEFDSILRFWLDRGVDGFRIDVAHGLAKNRHLPDLGSEHQDLIGPPDRRHHPHWDRDEVHEIYRGWRKLIDEYRDEERGDRIFVAEAWVAKPYRLACYVRPDELHTVFNLDFLRCAWSAEGFRAVIDCTSEALHEVGAPATWVLSNHDVPRHVTRYGKPHTRMEATPHHLICERTDLELGTRRARAAALLMLALPGGAYVYQGEEIGLWEVEDLPEEVLQDPTWHRSGHTVRGRDGCRVPIPWWGEEPPFGFGPDGTWLPQPAEWAALTVEAEMPDPYSMLSLYRAALRIRREHPALGDGEMRWVDAPPDVLAFVREPGLLCIVNLSDQSVRLPPHTEVLLRSNDFVDGDRLPVDSAVWLAVSAT